MQISTSLHLILVRLIGYVGSFEQLGERDGVVYAESFGILLAGDDSVEIAVDGVRLGFGQLRLEPALIALLTVDSLHPVSDAICSSA